MDSLRLWHGWVRQGTNRGPARDAEVINYGKSFIRLHMYISTGMIAAGGEAGGSMLRHRR